MAQAYTEDIIKMNLDVNSFRLIKYNNDDDFKYAEPAWFLVVSFYELHTFIVIKIALKCKEKGVDITTVKFDKKNYVSWLDKNKFCHCSQHRSEWGSLLSQLSNPH